MFCGFYGFFFSFDFGMNFEIVFGVHRLRKQVLSQVAYKMASQCSYSLHKHQQQILALILAPLVTQMARF